MDLGDQACRRFSRHPRRGKGHQDARRDRHGMGRRKDQSRTQHLGRAPRSSAAQGHSLMNAQSVDADKAAAYDPLNPAVTANPYPYYAALREHTPVKWLPSMQGFAVSRWDDVVKVLSDGKVFSSAQFWPALLGEYDPVPE